MARLNSREVTNLHQHYRQQLEEQDARHRDLVIKLAREQEEALSEHTRALEQTKAEVTVHHKMRHREVESLQFMNQQHPSLLDV